jgi:uncharacterized repeat protein (TIGR01451 family)
VPSGATGSTYADTATASASDATSVSATDTDALSSTATLAITNTDNDGGSSVTSAKGTAVPGTSITYTIGVTNSGPSNAANLSVVDTLPTQGLTNISSPSLPAGVTFNSTTETWSLASLAAGQSVTLELAGTIPSGATGSTYTNTANASASDASTSVQPPTLTHWAPRPHWPLPRPTTTGILRHLGQGHGSIGDRSPTPSWPRTPDLLPPPGHR